MYLKAYETPQQADIEIRRYFRFYFYNEKRQHQELERKTPDKVYYADLLREQKAA